MHALDALLNRVSVARLGAPAPSLAQREQMLRAALRAPDHGQLRPWRFIEVEGEALQALGELFAQGLQARQPQADEAALSKARAMPLRAPLLLIVVASPVAHFKVPQEEQIQSAACAAHAVLLAAHAQGVGAVWRTGEMATDPLVKQGLGLAVDEQVLAFIYLGTPLGNVRTAPVLEPAQFLQRWQGPQAE